MKRIQITQESIRGIIVREKVISEIIGNEDGYYFQNRVVGGFLRANL
jgi:hypothetical protein